PPPEYSRDTIQGQREIEVDSTFNVYVASAQALNGNDWILIYDDTLANPNQSERRERINAYIHGPTAMLVVGNTLYVASSTDLPDTTTTQVHRFSINRTGGHASSLIYDAAGGVTIGNMRHVTSIVQN